MEHTKWKQKHPEDSEFLDSFGSLSRRLRREFIEAKSRKAPNIDALRQEWLDLWERKAECEKRRAELFDEWDKRVTCDADYRVLRDRTERLERAITLYQENHEVRTMMSGLGWAALELMTEHLKCNLVELDSWEHRAPVAKESYDATPHWQDGL